MQKKEMLNSVINDIEDTIVTYYDYSFRIENEKCMVLVEKLIGQLERLFIYIDREQIALLQGVLLRVVQAMESKDYVLLRDILYYDFRQILIALA